jgi:cytochrome c peroxidase
VGTRFQNILVSELNVAGNPVQEFVFNKGLSTERHVFSPDIGRSAITGVTDLDDITFSNFNAFKIPQLRGIRDTGPYFHDNSAKTLEECYGSLRDVLRNRHGRPRDSDSTGSGGHCGFHEIPPVTL